MKLTSAYNQILPNIKSFINFSFKPNHLIHFLVGLHLCITLPLAAILNIWTDEAYSLDTAGKNLQYAINQAINFELQPPLYFVLLNIWRIFNDSIFWARLFSIISIVLTIYVVVLLSERFIKTIHPAWIVASFALNPFVIKVALEIRVYAFAMLLSALLLLFFFDGYFSERSQTKAKVLYLLFSILALYTQYYLGCLLLANAVVLLISGRWKSLLHYLLGMIVVSICFAPMLFFLFNQVSTHTTYFDNNFWDNFIFLQQYKIQRFLANFSALPKAILIYCYLSILLFVFGLIFLTDRRLITSEHLAIWTINITSIVFFTFVLVITKGMLFFRHTVGIFIVYFLGLFLLLSLIKYKRIRKTMTIFLTITALLFYSQNIYKNYSRLAKIGDWKRVGEYIMNSEQPEQEIIVFTSISAVELSYHYSGINTIIPLPKADDFKSYDLQKYALNNEEEIVKALKSNRHDIWLVENVNSRCSYFNVNFNCHILEDFVSKYYEVENSKKFYRTRVRFLHRKPNH